MPAVNKSVLFRGRAQSPASNPQAPTLAQAQMAELKQTTLGVTLSSLMRCKSFVARASVARLELNELNAAWRTMALEGLEESHKPPRR